MKNACVQMEKSALSCQENLRSHREFLFPAVNRKSYFSTYFMVINLQTQEEDEICSQFRQAEVLDTDFLSKTISNLIVLLFRLHAGR